MPRGTDIIDLPHPFVIEPPNEDKTAYQSGDALAFNLMLFGKAVEDFPYIIVALKGMEDTPIGMRGRRGTIELRTIYVSGVNIYDSADERLHEYRLPCPAGCGPVPLRGVTLKFLTPMRIMLDKKLQKRLPFMAFFKTLIRRISSLKYYYMGEQMDQNEIRRLIELSGKIDTFTENTSWHDWKRYSSRQKEVMNLGGLVGTITYSGDMEPFWTYLQMGEIIHAGKNTSFGLGKYEIVGGQLNGQS